MSKPQSFIEGTLTLVMTGLAVRVLGFFLRLVMIRTVGEEAIGLYHLILPTFFFIFTFTQFGLPVAVSQRVSKYCANKDFVTVRRILYLSIVTGLAISLATSSCLYIIKDTLLIQLFSDRRVKLALTPLLCLIPLATVSSILKDFFQGLHNMKPQGISQLLEQVTRLALLIYGMKDYSNDTVAVLTEKLLWQSVYSECVGLGFLAVTYLRTSLPQSVTTLNANHLMKQLFSIALPTTGMRLVHSFGHFLEPLIIHHPFVLSGLSIAGATRAYGLLTGYIFPLLSFPIFITQAIATATIPSVTDAIEKQNHRLIHYRIHQVIRYSMMIGIYFTVILMVFPHTLLHLFYDTAEGLTTIKLMAPCYIFTYLHFPLHAVLQASDNTDKAMINSLISFFIKIAALTLFMRILKPTVGIIIAFSILSITSSWLHYRSVTKTTGYRITQTFIMQLIGLFLCFFFLTIGTRYLLEMFSAIFLHEIMGLILLTINYIPLVLLFGLIPKSEWTTFVTKH